jgi:hypothetical protein
MPVSKTELIVTFQVTDFQRIPRFPEHKVASRRIEVTGHIDTFLEESKTALGNTESLGRFTLIT